MSDTAYFAHTRVSRPRFLSVEHGSSEVTITAFSDDRYRQPVDYTLGPDEAERFANDLLRRVAFIRERQKGGD